MSPCIPITDHKGKRVGFLCVGNEPVEVQHKGRTYRFEWHPFCGWIPLNKDGSERLRPVSKAVWDKLLKQEEARQ